MKTSVKTQALLGAGILLLIPALASADTIYLKNGMYIVVSRATEKDGQIEYWVGSTKYTISKDLVAKIEAGDGPSSGIRSAAPIDRTAPAVQDLSHREADRNTANPKHAKIEMRVPGGPRQDGPYWVALRSRILQGDRVNEMKLAEIELDHDARTTSDAYFLAGVTEMQAGATETASAYFERGLQAT